MVFYCVCIYCVFLRVGVCFTGRAPRHTSVIPRARRAACAARPRARARAPRPRAGGSGSREPGPRGAGGETLQSRTQSGRKLLLVCLPAYRISAFDSCSCHQITRGVARSRARATSELQARGAAAVWDPIANEESGETGSRPALPRAETLDRDAQGGSAAAGGCGGLRREQALSGSGAAAARRGRRASSR